MVPTLRASGGGTRSGETANVGSGTLPPPQRERTVAEALGSRAAERLKKKTDSARNICRERSTLTDRGAECRTAASRIVSKPWLPRLSPPPLQMRSIRFCWNCGTLFSNTRAVCGTPQQGQRVPNSCLVPKPPAGECRIKVAASGWLSMCGNRRGRMIRFGPVSFDSFR